MQYFGTVLGRNEVCQIPFAKIALERGFEASLVLHEMTEIVAEGVGGSGE